MKLLGITRLVQVYSFCLNGKSFKHVVVSSYDLVGRAS